MDTFNIIAGTASIISLGISIISFFMVKEVKKNIANINRQFGDNNKSVNGNKNQTVQANDVSGGKIMQAGGDIIR